MSVVQGLPGVGGSGTLRTCMEDEVFGCGVGWSVGVKRREREGDMFQRLGFSGKTSVGCGEGDLDVLYIFFLLAIQSSGIEGR